MSKINLALVASDVNHLRRLLAYIDLELGQEPEAMVATLKKIAPALMPEIDPDGIQRLKESYDKSVAVPKYVRAAIKALKKTLASHGGEVVDVDSVRVVRQIGE